MLCGGDDAGRPALQAASRGLRTTQQCSLRSTVLYDRRRTTRPAGTSGHLRFELTPSCCRARGRFCVLTVALQSLHPRARRHWQCQSCICCMSSWQRLRRCICVAAAQVSDRQPTILSNLAQSRRQNTSHQSKWPRPSIRGCHLYTSAKARY